MRSGLPVLRQGQSLRTAMRPHLLHSLSPPLQHGITCDIERIGVDYVNEAMVGGSPAGMAR